MHDLEQELLTGFGSNFSQTDKSVAVACSGGPDSMALTLLAQIQTQKTGCQLTALIVDHGLRPESGREAVRTQRWLTGRGIACEILQWHGPKPRANIQEEARKARYRLMGDYCHAHVIGCLLVAHHLEDQAETFLLRLARGSGVDGLSAMAMQTELYGMTVLRPLLDVPKAKLLDYLALKQQDYIRDSSNENEAFDRVKMRKLLPQLAQTGLTPARLAGAARTLARARDYLEAQTEDFLGRQCRSYPMGYATLALGDTHSEIALRGLVRIIRAISGSLLMPRMDDLERLLAALRQPAFKGATLGGCVFKPHRGNLLVYREPRAVAPPIPITGGETLVWDGRFAITAGHVPEGATLGALGQAGWLDYKRPHALPNPEVPKAVLYTLPALRDAKSIIMEVLPLNRHGGISHCRALFHGLPEREAATSPDHPA